MTVTPPTSSSSNMSSGTMATSDHPVHGRCRATIQADPRRSDPRPTSPGRRLRSESGSTADFAERVALTLGVLPVGAQGPALLILSPLVLGELGAVVLGALLGVAGADLTVGQQGDRHRRGRGVQGEQQHASQAYRSTSSRLSTLPDGPSGIASTNSTLRGYLYLAIRSFDQVMIAAPSSSSLPSASGERTTTAQTSSPSCGSGTAITATCATASWRSSTSSTSRG